jgi:RNA polymerase sigma-70 factor (sigma-E family)
LEALVDDSEESFREFVGARQKALLRTAWLLVGDAHLAEDLVQTALSKAAMRWERIVAHGDPEPYVRRIIYTEHVSWWRRRRFTEVLGASLDDQPGDAVDVPLQVAMQRALAKLTPKQRAVLVLRYYEDLSESQTAEVLDVAIGTVKSQTRHALARLKALAPEIADLVEVRR